MLTRSNCLHKSGIRVMASRHSKTKTPDPKQDILVMNLAKGVKFNLFPGLQIPVLLWVSEPLPEKPRPLLLSTLMIIFNI